MSSINQYTKHTGFTLVEVMIALVVMAIGMLGLASIQAVSLQNNQTAYMRTIAMQSAYNITDLIRTSKLSDGSVDSTFDAVTSALPNSAPTSCIVDNNTTNCSASDMAASDIYQWKVSLKDSLPSGRGTIANASGVYTITIMWDEDRTGADGEGCGSDYTVDLKCYVLEVQI